jgi:hypothetical protein
MPCRAWAIALYFNAYKEKRTIDDVDCVWNVMAHAQKPDFVFRRNGRVHLNRQGRPFSRRLAGELCTSACRVSTARASLCSAVMWRLLVTHSILLFPFHFSSRASSCAITFQTQSTSITAAIAFVFQLSCHLFRSRFRSEYLQVVSSRTMLRW